MSLTDEQAALLRKPFPRNVIGSLPKPYKKDSPKSNCPECGTYHGLPAVHLDFVGHAATTDRLLQVDPAWTWEPMAVDQFGSPQLDRDGNLWIRLTIHGVTRIGVGDGSSMKERIGDAIRNAAMRFGVALDLWSKDELEQTSGEGAQKLRATLASAPTPPAAPLADNDAEPAPKPQPKAPVETGEAMKPRTRGQMFALFADLEITDEDTQRRGMSQIIGKPVESRGDLTEAQARAVIKALQDRKAAKG